MNLISKIIAIVVVLTSCNSSNNKSFNSEVKIDYNKIIEDYLETKKIEPNLVYNNYGRNKFDLLDHQIIWKSQERGVEITVDGNKWSTSDKVTTNPVWGSNIDSVNFTSYLRQIKIYEYDSLIGFVLTSNPCTGLGCGVNYQIIYDLRTGNQTYFGRFRTGMEFELYNFNSDGSPDYLSKTFYGRNAQGIDTTEFVLYSYSSDGIFEEFTNENNEKYYFKYSYSEFNMDLNNENFNENWIEKINKTAGNNN